MSSEKLPCPFKVGDIVRLVLPSYVGDVGDVGVVTRTRDGVINSEPGAGSCQPRGVGAVHEWRDLLHRRRPLRAALGLTTSNANKC